MRIILELDPANGTVGKWIVTVDDDTSDTEPSTGRLTRTQMKNLAGTIDEMLRAGAPDWANEPIDVARRVGEAHFVNYAIRRPVDRSAVGIEF